MRCLAVLCGVLLLTSACDGSSDDPPQVDSGDERDAGTPPAREVTFDKITLHRDFYCEGAALGDLDGDGQADAIAGPHWYPGPDFDEQLELWPAPQPADVYGYSDCFFEWTRDLDADGDLDVLVVGFPGQAAFWMENPGARDGTWSRHAVVDVVDNEAPEYLDLIGSAEPELLFANAGKLVYATHDGEAWSIHAISEDRGFPKFMHGLGAADVNGDGRKDVLEATAWWEQPQSLAGDPLWTRHEQAFGAGGAQMYGYDVDADGDTDVVATHAAHGYGLDWHEQRAGGGFVAHEIVPADAPEDGGVIIHEPHALAIADVDGDGLTDLITGERHWGHVPEGTPDFAAAAHIYWFRLIRDGDGVRFEPHLIDDDSGVGTQLTFGDIDGDDRVDLVIANKKGAFVFKQR